jgi:colanic acid/amylovoran biosynthesis glycosyltransferase
VSAENKLTVLIYADPLLASSETFVLAQGEALESFIPYYIGPRRLGDRGLKMPADRTLAINGMGGQIGRIREAPFRFFGYAPIYFRRVRKLKPVLLHAHFGPGGLRALSLSNWLGIPLVTTFHGFDATIKDSFAAKSKYGSRHYVHRKHILKERGRLFLAVSKFIKGKIREQGFAEEKTILHYIGVDTKFFTPDQELKRDLIVLFTGRLTQKKGCEYLIHAMARVQALRPELELVIIGDGPLRQKLEVLARGTLRRFRFLGVQPPGIVKQWMNRAKVFSVPSVVAESGDAEGFGMVFAEAQAMGCPVASFASGGIPEAVAHGQTGLLAKERDVETLSQNILLLGKDESLWKQMSEAGRNRVCALFNLHTQTKRLEDIYHQVLGHYEKSNVRTSKGYAF